MKIKVQKANKILNQKINMKKMKVLIGIKIYLAQINISMLLLILKFIYKYNFCYQELGLYIEASKKYSFATTTSFSDTLKQFYSNNNKINNVPFIY